MAMAPSLMKITLQDGCYFVMRKRAAKGAVLRELENGDGQNLDSETCTAQTWYLMAYSMHSLSECAVAGYA